MTSLIQNIHYKETSANNNADHVLYSDQDNDMWCKLYNKQKQNLIDLAYQNIIESIEQLDLPHNYVPQLSEVSKKLYQKTGWKVEKVEELIDSTPFFERLANRIFPSTITIRKEKELGLSRDPDIFHELFGHCPILLNEQYAIIFEKFGKIGLKFDSTQRAFLARLFWFTFEVGLIQTTQGLKIYGGSLLSSMRESRYAIKSLIPARKKFDMIDIFRTPYRADLMQPIYYITHDIRQILSVFDNVELIKSNIEIAYNLVEFTPLFPVENKYKKYMSYDICKTINLVKP